MNKDELRPCIVEIMKYQNKHTGQCGIAETEVEAHKGYFHCWDNEAYVTNGLAIGTVSGQVSTLYGIVEYEDGSVHRVAPECISFTDNEKPVDGKMTKADKKQIPQKVLYEDIGYDQYENVNVYACICPSCGLHIIRYDDNDIKCFDGDGEAMFHSSMVHHGYMGLNSYCNRCGQKLKWR